MSKRPKTPVPQGTPPEGVLTDTLFAFPLSALSDGQRAAAEGLITGANRPRGPEPDADLAILGAVDGPGGITPGVLAVMRKTGMVVTAPGLCPYRRDVLTALGPQVGPDWAGRTFGIELRLVTGDRGPQLKAVPK